MFPEKSFSLNNSLISVQITQSKWRELSLKRSEFLSFTKNIGRNIGKNLSSKYTQKPVDNAKQSATDERQTASKRTIQKSSKTNW